MRVNKAQALSAKLLAVNLQNELEEKSGKT
jgi:hypothetical protein